MTTMLFGTITPVYFDLKGGREGSEELVVKCPQGLAFGGAAVKALVRANNKVAGEGVTLMICGNKSSSEIPQQWSLAELKEGLLISPLLDGSTEFLISSSATEGFDAAPEKWQLMIEFEFAYNSCR